MKPHVALLPTSGMGHIIPLFQLAKHLVLHHDVHVSFLVITSAASAAQDEFFRSPTATAIPDLTIINLPAVDVSTIINDDMGLVTRTSIILRESLKPLKSILTEIATEPLAALIIDIFATDVIDVCKEMSIPVYSFFTASTFLLTFSLYLPTLHGEVDGEYVDLPAPIKVPGCHTPLRIEDLPDPIKDRTNAEYDWYLLHVSRLPEVSGIFLNVWVDLDYDRINALKENSFSRNILTPPVYPIGPLIKDSEATTEKDPVLVWLDSQPRESVLYVCLGSGGTLSSKQLVELAWGLEFSRKRFILVVRQPTDVSASATYFNVGSINNDPSSYLPDGFLERTLGFGLVVADWCRQLEVLRHPSTGAFLSHCGWNSTLESLVSGVPMIAWPLYAEQRMNAAMLVEEVGVAVRVEAMGGEEVIGREEIERVVREVMEGEERKAIKRKAQKLKESAAMAMEAGGSSARWISGVVDVWKSK